MNLHINLLLKSEERSASRISRGFIIKVSAVVAGLLLAALVSVVLIGANSAEQSLLFAEQEKKQLDNAYRTVLEFRQELAGLQDLTNAIAAWVQTRPDWPALLSGVPSIVPANIQLTRLTANESITAVDNAPMRIVTLYLQGKAAGEHSERDVQELEKNLKDKPPFNGIVEFAKVKQFEAVKNDARENMRVFDIECRFKALKLFQPAKAEDQAAKQVKKK